MEIMIRIGFIAAVVLRVFQTTALLGLQRSPLLGLSAPDFSRWPHVLHRAISRARRPVLEESQA